MPATKREPLNIDAVNRRFVRLLRRKQRAKTRRKSIKGGVCGWLKHYMPIKFARPFSSMHRKMGRRVAYAEDKRGIVEGYCAPRGGAKTTFISEGVPIRAVCEGTERYIVLAADTLGQAAQRLENVAFELENNAELARDYPHVIGRGPTWNVEKIVTRNGITIIAAAIRKRIRGTKKGDDRPTLIVADDLDDDDAPYSPRKREKNWAWFTSALIPLGVTGHTNIFVVGTALHRECVVCRLPENGIRLETFSAIQSWPVRTDMWEEWLQIYRDTSLDDTDLRAENALQFFLNNEDEMTKGARVLWPSAESLYQLMVERARIGVRAFENEKQGNALDPTSTEWPRDCFTGDVWFDDWPQGIQVQVTALDPSKGKEDKPGDFQGIVSVGYKNNILYVDADINRRPVPAMTERFVGMCGETDSDVGVVEDAAFQDLIIPEAEETAMQQDLSCPILPIGHEGKAKELRIRRTLGPYINRGRVMYKRRSEGANRLMSQLGDFPNGSHDDGPDAMEMAVRKIKRMLASRKRKAPRNPQ